MIRRSDRDEKVKKPRGAKMHWTAEDKRQLKTMALTDNIYVMARHFKRTPSAILSMAYKLGVPVITKRRAPWPR